jgi:hypothetical protein
MKFTPLKKDAFYAKEIEVTLPEYWKKKNTMMFISKVLAYFPKKKLI